MSYSYQLRNLHYSHDSINCTFQDGTPLTKLCEDFLSGRVTLDTLPRLGVKHIHNKNFVMEGNRRLFVLRMLQNHGMLPRDTVWTQPFPGYKKITAKRTFRIRNDPHMIQKINNLIVGHKLRKREEEASMKNEERKKQNNLEEELEKAAKLEEKEQEKAEKLDKEEPAKQEKMEEVDKKNPGERRGRGGTERKEQKRKCRERL